MGQAAQQADERLVIAKATLMDDLYMAKFFEGQPRCAEVVLRAVLGNPSLRVISVDVRRDVLSLGSRSVQLDIAAEDEDGRLYDVEVQRDPGRAEPQRARLYAALIDSQALGKGAGFADLPESYVIFIVNGDALGDGVPLSVFERTRLQDGRLFGDGSRIVYVDASYNFGDTVLGDVMHDFVCPDPDSMRNPVLAERARYFKKAEKGAEEMGDVIYDFIDEQVEKRVKEQVEKRVKEQVEKRVEEQVERRVKEQVDERMKLAEDEIRQKAMRTGLEQGIEQGIERGIEQGLERGREQERAEMVARLASNGNLSREAVAELLGMTVDEVDACISAAERLASA